jgi:hypothetical protein
MLPSSLAKVLPFTLAAFCQPTSVGLRYGRAGHSLGAFLGGTGPGPSARGRPRASRAASGLAPGDFPPAAPYAARRALSTTQRGRPPPRPPVAQARPARCRNLDLLSIDYALRPRLRSDFPWVDHPGPGTLGLPVAGIPTLLSRYSYRHSHFRALHPRSRSGFAGARNAPLPRHLTAPSAASAAGLSPATFSARDRWTSELLRTRSRVAASEPTSWLSSRSHILVH